MKRIKGLTKVQSQLSPWGNGLLDLCLEEIKTKRGYIDHDRDCADEHNEVDFDILVQFFDGQGHTLTKNCEDYSIS